MPKTVIAVLAVLAALGATAAVASEHGRRHHREGEGDHHGRREHEGRRRNDVSGADAEARALYRKECGACHLDYPPRFLPAEAHRLVMAGLERHFGQDAELDPAVRDRIERFLAENAADAGSARTSREALGSRAAGTSTRVTEATWFRRKHRRIEARAAESPSVRSLANCAACHPGAQDWDFDDDRVRIPAR